jgi:DNA-binding response OmpR family regulator
MNVAQPDVEDTTDHEVTSPGTRWPRILLADDDHDLRAYLAKRLRRVGYVVTESPDGAGVLEMIGSMLVDRTAPSEMPDLVVLDVRMPGIDGLQVLCGLRNANWSLPVLMMTARDDDEIPRQVTRLGANGLLRKPFSAQTFVESVDGLLRSG